MSEWSVAEPGKLTFDDPVAALHVRIVNGTVNVVGVDEGPARLEVTELEGPPLTVTRKDGTLTVAYEDLPWRNLLGWLDRKGRHRSATVSLAVPAHIPVEVGVVGAAAMVSGTAGRTEVKGVTGDTTLVGLSGPVRATTVSGNLEAQALGGDLRFHSVSGDLTVVECAGSTVRADSVSGSMILDLDASDGPTDMSLTSVSGEIAIRLPHPADAEVEVNTASGAVSNAFEDLRVSGQWGAKRITGRLGAGSGRLKATTVSGSIALLRRPPSEDTPWDEPAPSTAPGPALRHRGTRRRGARPAGPPVPATARPRPPVRPTRRGSDMPPVFAHGRLRLYLLKLLDEAPRHGYEVIRLLEERFQGLYAPSAGTVYPRLAKLEAEGLVTHTTEGGRKVYAITDAGRAELADRSGELADLELEIRESVAELAAEIRADVRGAAGDLRREMRAAADEARDGAAGGGDKGRRGEHERFPGDFAGYADSDSWRAAKEEMRRVRQEWKEQTRRAKDESRRAREEAQRARRQAKEAQERARAQAQEELQRVARRVQEQVQDHFARGDWPTGLREGLSELAKEFGDFGRAAGKDFGFGRQGTAPAPEPEYTVTREDFPAGYEPSWAHEESTGDPARDLDRLLDRFRDDIRDTARDHGVSEEQLREARRHLSTAAAHIGAALRTPRTPGD